ncbi:MAG TPA: hypothetical protein VGU73_02755, partial [Acidimicrobiia bacterium]|nr:hypothetical protein [Acidimicrobiia bacterium]
MSIAKRRVTEAPEPAPVTVEPDGLGDGEAALEPSEPDRVDRLARFRQGLLRVPIWVTVEVAVVVAALLIALVTR